MDWIADPQIWIAFLTLTVLELVLGIDNVIFISILSGKLPAEQQKRARFIGLLLALGMRVLLLLSLSWIIGLTAPLFGIFGHEFSGRDLVLLIGGLFLIGKSTHEIHGSLEGEEGTGSRRSYPGFTSVIIQIMLLDIVFSLDSVITAVGMVNIVPVMIAAIILAVLVMIFIANPIGDFIDRNPTIKMLALAFIILVGVALVCDGLGIHIARGYLYFAMAFSAAVESLNLLARRRRRQRKAKESSGER